MVLLKSYSYSEGCANRNLLKLFIPVSMGSECFLSLNGLSIYYATRYLKAFFMGSLLLATSGMRVTRPPPNVNFRFFMSIFSMQDLEACLPIMRDFSLASTYSLTWGRYSSVSGSDS